jgi:thiamine pyrophosphokinase
VRIVIFSNGRFEHVQQDRARIQEDDLLIAADGGLHHCLALELTPHILVGDLDSVDSDQVDELRESGTEIHEHPTRKNHTDLELALALASTHNPDEILILGGLGGRWDQTLATILLLCQERFQGQRILVVDGPQQIQTVTSGQTLTITGTPGSIVSLIPIKADAHGISTHGLEYELSNGTLKLGTSRGVSNVLIDKNASITLKRGTLACVIIAVTADT